MPLRFGALKVTTPPTVDPVTVAQAKAQLKILHSNEDQYLLGLIKVACEWAQDYTRLAFLTQTLTAQYPSWPSPMTPNCAKVDSTFLLPHPPLQLVNWVKYYDTTDTLITYDPTKYVVDIIQSPGTVRVKNTSYNTPSVPCLSTNFVNPVSISYKAGFGDAAASLPARIQQAVLIMVAHLYSRRTPVIIDMRLVMVEVPLSVYSLLDPLKIHLV